MAQMVIQFPRQSGCGIEYGLVKEITVQTKPKRTYRRQGQLSHAVCRTSMGSQDLLLDLNYAHIEAMDVLNPRAYHKSQNSPYDASVEVLVIHFLLMISLSFI